MVVGAIAMCCPPGLLHKHFLPGAVASDHHAWPPASIPSPGVLPVSGHQPSPWQHGALLRWFVQRSVLTNAKP